MTSPVEHNYGNFSKDYFGWNTVDSWTMSFLYRTAELGPTGNADGVQVIDRPEITVASYAVEGDYGLDTVVDALNILKSALGD